MTEDEIVERGIRSQEVLINPTVSYVIENLINEITSTFLSSLPDQEDARQRAYYAYQGVRDIVGLLNSWVAVKDQIIKAREAELDNEDGN